jgi:hypothetical protein
MEPSASEKSGRNGLSAARDPPCALQKDARGRWSGVGGEVAPALTRRLGSLRSGRTHGTSGFLRDPRGEKPERCTLLSGRVSKASDGTSLCPGSSSVKWGRYWYPSQRRCAEG